MASITIRRLDDATKAQLRIRAAQHGRSMEEEARAILKGSLARTKSGGRTLVERIRAPIAPLGGVAIPETPREPMREPPDFRK